MLRRYLTFKKNELQVKMMLYGTILKLIVEKEGIVNLLSNIYDALKDVSVDELRTEVTEKMAELMKEVK